MTLLWLVVFSLAPCTVKEGWSWVARVRLFKTPEPFSNNNFQTAMPAWRFKRTEASDGCQTPGAAKAPRF